VTSAKVASVNVGRAKDAPWVAELGCSAIDKRPVTGPVRVGRLGLAGDQQADTRHHGGPEQAVYAYAREDLDWWAGQLGRELADGSFGENITSAGLDMASALIGEVWRLGGVTVQVTAPRIPCATFSGWMAEPRWVKRFAQANRTGAYLRVLGEGEVSAGDALEVVSRPAERVTVAESVLAFYGDAGLMRALLRVEGRGGKWDKVAARVLGQTAAGI
jgi:MOSC domain-containing protein YiiM